MTFDIFLSPPDVGPLERAMLLDAFDSGWIAPVGPHLDAFEREMTAAVQTPYAVALASGTAALHLALRGLGVGAGDVVVVPSFTFAATVNAVLYVGATPVFVDVDARSWTVDVGLLADVLDDLERRGRPAGAVIPVDLYGQCADYDRLLEVCSTRGVVVVEDAAEALGSSYRGRPAGSFGHAAAFSFNGNKIVTCSGGGMLVTDDAELARVARHLASQAREPVAHYEHRTVGYNYRLSNLLAAVGCAQLDGLDRKVKARREINRTYRRELADVPGISFMPVADYGDGNCWLTCILVDPEECGATPDQLRLRLEAAGIESRRTWKPLHLQPAYHPVERYGGAVCEHVFERGLCLPSGSGLTEDQQGRVIGAIRRAVLEQRELSA